MKNPWKQYSQLSPQRENGNRQIASDVFRALMTAELSGTEFRLVLAIIDKTWGFNKESDCIAISQLMETTGIAERTVKESIKILKEKRVIFYAPSDIRVRCGSPINEFLFNKHYDTWKTQGCRKVHACTVTSGKGALLRKKRVHQSAHTIETLQKKVIQKKMPLSLPDWIPVSAWNDFVEHRKALGGKFTVRAQELIIASLTALKDDGQDPVKVINQSIERGWKGVFKVKHFLSEGGTPWYEQSS
jgi:phage replication O-like protein O